ncbi:hypothetical protein MUP01_13920 [Candidatus Bathyarchaeota archaeon]|nr:hypothetical protein [Candidatus Bathyarchaeota archaeon]
MWSLRKLTTKEVALTISFTALYVVFGFLKISPIIGLPGQAITAAAIMAPLMGVILGPYISTLSTFLGGLMGFSFGSFSLLSIGSGMTAALCSGLVCRGKRVVSVLIYSSLLLFLAFYPVVGVAWLYPASLWFQIVGLIILVSPLQTVAVRSFDSNNDSMILYAFFVVSLSSTLAGQIAGSLTLEMIHIPNVDYFKGTWQTITVLYPIERMIIALAAALIGAPLYKVLRHLNMLPLNVSKQKEIPFVEGSQTSS